MMKRQLSPGWLLFILTGLNLFNYLDRAVLAAVLPPLSADLNLNKEQGGSAYTAFMIGYFVTAPFFGYLGDRLSRRWLIAGGIFVWSLGTILTGFAKDFNSLIIFRVLVGVGEASYATISPSIIADKFIGLKRNTALTIFYVAIPVGSALGYGIASAIAEYSNWRHAFIWAGAPGLLLAMALLPFAEPERAAAKEDAKPTPRDILRLLTIPNYLLVVFGYTAYTFALGAFQHWGASFLNEERGISLATAGLFFGGSLAVTGLVGTFLGGLVGSAWQKKSNAGYALLCAVTVALAVPAAAGAFLTRDTYLSMGLLSVAMLFLFFSTGPLNTLILETSPAHVRASAMAVSIFMIHLFGDLWSPRIVGRVADASSLGRAVLILPVALAVAALLWFALAGRMRKPANTPMESSANNTNPS
jgi:MFS family permease